MPAETSYSPAFARMSISTEVLLTLPSRFAARLAEQPVLDGSVRLTLTTFTPWLSGSGLPFFPEYTDHGPTHLRDVIATTEMLIADTAWDRVSSGDVAALVLSVLLHDAAMHLTEDGFLALVGVEGDEYLIAGFGDRPWRELWQDFLAEARRFDARKLISLFGDQEPVGSLPADPQDWTRRHRLLIGEFLRRHHHRLGHEMARFGVPGPVGMPRLRLVEVPAAIADLAGVVARSHGTSIRAAMEYVRRHYDVREFQGVHATFLMTLLRVADYLQLQAARAPATIFQVRRLRSPVSRAEWGAHHAIRDVRHTHDDPEAVFIDAQPADVITYLRVRRWLDGLQAELDESWAALGEVYGRFPALAGLGLVLRRVRSNLDDLEKLSAHAPYVPRAAQFTVAHADVLQLLVAPLYGGDPAMGVRELVQNAVDGVRELDWRRTIPPYAPGGATQSTESATSSSTPAEPADVVVSLEGDGNGASWLVVADRGVGMTEDVVCDYFLRAGASFRRSDAWRQQYESDTGESQVLRSGRFGIGVLAAFLLGDEIEVITRHIDAPADRGITFTASLNTDFIELRRTTRDHGTTIRIRLNERASEALDHENNEEARSPLDWYCLGSPSIALSYYGEEIEQLDYMPGPGEELPPHWHRLTVRGFVDVHWTFEDGPVLTCNGLIVQDQPQKNLYIPSGVPGLPHAHDFMQPGIAVYDPDGHLPLTLDRTRLAAPLPFAGELERAVAEDFLAFAISRLPEGPVSDPALSAAYVNLQYRGWAAPHDLWSGWLPWWSTMDGTAFLTSWSVSRVPIARAFLVPIPLHVDGDTATATPSIPLGPGDAAFAYRGATTVEALRAWAWTLLGRRVLLRGSVLDELRKKFSRHMRAEIKPAWNESGWVLLERGECPPWDTSLGAIVEQAKNDTLSEWRGLLGIWYVGEPREDMATPEDPLVGEVWRHTIGGILIPFSREERYRRYATFLTQHAATVRAHEADDAGSYGARGDDW